MRHFVARLPSGASVSLPEDPRQHVFAATGEVSLAGLGSPALAGMILAELRAAGAARAS